MSERKIRTFDIGQGDDVAVVNNDGAVLDEGR